MKITGVKTYVLEGLLGDQAFGWSLWVTDRRQSALCVVTTDEGIEGAVSYTHLTLPTIYSV